MRMKTRSGHSVSPVGLGTWRIRNPEQARRALQNGVALGLNHIDTAELYEMRGGSETMLGRLWDTVARDDVFLASKVLPQNASRQGVRRALEASLARLQTDAVDLYYHHWPSEGGQRDALEGLADVLDAGLTRFVGVSNYDVPELEEAREILGNKLVANQVLYHLEDRGCESHVLPWCQAHGVQLVGYSPFGQEAWIRSPGRLAVLESVAKAESLTPRQAALAFLGRNGAWTIPKSENVAHVDEIAGGRARLSPESITRLEDAFPLVPGMRTI